MLFTSSYRPAGTVTGRLASSKLLDTFGSNGQNLPDHIRRLLTARPGHLLCQCDLEGAEAVAVALLCEEGNFRELVRRKVKIHNFVCVKIFPSRFSQFFAPDEIDLLTPVTFHTSPHYKAVISHCKSLKTEYDLAKRTVHGSNYSMGWRTFQESVLQGTAGQVVLTAAECKRLLNSYFTLFPEVKKFQAEADKAAQEFTPLTNLFNWSVQLIQRYTPAAGRTAISWRPQSTVGICGIVGAMRLQEYIETNNKQWNVLTVTHDSNLSEAPESEAKELAAASARALHFEFTSPIDGWKCAIGVEVALGKNWGKYHPTENPDGLKVV